MQRELSSILRKCFDTSIEDRFPEFHSMGAGKRRAYRCSLDGGGNVFVHLNVYDRYNAYGIELAWSSSQEYPWHLPAEIDLQSAVGASGRIVLLRDDGKRALCWNVVTGGDDMRADQPRTLAGALAGDGKWASGHPHQVEECVAATLTRLVEVLPPFVDRAREQLAQSALGGG